MSNNQDNTRPTWRKLSSKVIFKHPRISLIEDQVELPNGHKTSYLHFGGTGSGVTIIAINADNKILVEEEYSYPPNKWIYQFPGGGVPETEDIAEGANRELMEECNLRGGKLTHIGKFLYDNRRSAAHVHIFVARDLQPKSLDGDLEEDIKINWFTEAEIDGLIATGEIENVMTLAAWTLYKHSKLV
ncbi:MAG TPA: NUDIX hydrolase [Patescibacteria group bacterium]|nr:NUDIX hydrolase [Patescibacteria group bacterium]